MGRTILEEQRAAFERDGFLIVRDALPPKVAARLIQAADRLYEEGVGREGLSARNHWQMRNCIVRHQAFLDLLLVSPFPQSVLPVNTEAKIRASVFRSDSTGTIGKSSTCQENCCRAGSSSQNAAFLLRLLSFSSQAGRPGLSFPAAPLSYPR